MQGASESPFRTLSDASNRRALAMLGQHDPSVRKSGLSAVMTPVDAGCPSRLERRGPDTPSFEPLRLKNPSGRLICDHRRRDVTSRSGFRRYGRYARRVGPASSSRVLRELKARDLLTPSPECKGPDDDPTTQETGVAPRPSRLSVRSRVRREGVPGSQTCTKPQTGQQVAKLQERARLTNPTYDQTPWDSSPSATIQKVATDRLQVGRCFHE